LLFIPNLAELISTHDLFPDIASFVLKGDINLATNRVYCLLPVAVCT